MTPEELALLENPDGAPPSSEQLEADVEDIESEIGDVGEILADHARMSEERHTQILTRLDECQNRLENLSTTAAENPMFTQLLNQVTELRVEVGNLKSSLQNLSRNALSASPIPSQEPETPASQSPAESIEGQEPVEANHRASRKYF